MRRFLSAAATVVVLSGVLAPSLLSAWGAPARHACCSKVALGGMDRPPCCVAGEVRTGPAAPAVLPERTAPVLLLARVSTGAQLHLLEIGSPADASRPEGLARALGPPLRLRI